MKAKTKRKIAEVGLKIVSIASSVGVPMAAVLQEFPVFKEQADGKELSVGGVMILLIVLFGFRRQLWPIIREKLHVNSVGALIFWGLAFMILMWMESIASILPALRTICIAGMVGTGVGQAADTVAGIIGRAGEKDKEVAENA